MTGNGRRRFLRKTLLRIDSYIGLIDEWFRLEGLTANVVSVMKESEICPL